MQETSPSAESVTNPPFSPVLPMAAILCVVQNNQRALDAALVAALDHEDAFSICSWKPPGWPLSGACALVRHRPAGRQPWRPLTGPMSWRREFNAWGAHEQESFPGSRDLGLSFHTHKKLDLPYGLVWFSSFCRPVLANFRAEFSGRGSTHRWDATQDYFALD